MQTREHLYIDGSWRTPQAGQSIEIIDSTTAQAFATVPLGDRGDLEVAVNAANRAGPKWAETSPTDRAGYVLGIADELEKRTEELVEIIVREVGMQAKMVRRVQIGLAVGDLRATAELVGNYPWEQEVGSSLVVREPIGVAACITPWNFPLHQATAKLAPALVAGCTVILKPSEVASLSAFLLTDAIVESGLPPGVFNLVTGLGPTVGEGMASHLDIDLVSFTGSGRAGRRVAELAAASVKRVALELGGKSPSVVLGDCDAALVERAVTATVNSCNFNSGQACNAFTRLIVPRAFLQDVEQLAVAAVERLSVGDPFEDTTRLGPLASQTQCDRVNAYVAGAIERGVRLLAGGPGSPAGYERGFYVRASVFSEVPVDDPIAQEEIFGPVLVIQSFTDEDEAIRMANGTIYGLAAAVWSGDVDHAHAIARRIHAGQVDINGAVFNPLAPFGGFKQSGIGREQGRFGVDEFVELKSLQRPSSPTD